MEEDRRNVGTSPKTIRSISILWTYIYLLLMLSERLSVSQANSHVHRVEKDARLAVTEEVGLVSSSKRTNNAIPEAEESTLEALRKYGAKKSESVSQTEQLDKPYPYIKSQDPIQNNEKTVEAYGNPLDNNIHQSKRSGSSDVVSVNGNVSISTVESESTTETESRSELEIETTTTASSTTAYQSTNSTTSTTEDVESNWSTTTDNANDQTSRTTSPEPQEKSTELFTTQNENLTLTRLISVPITTTLATISTMNQPDVSSTENSYIPSTITELTTTSMVQEESPITIITDDQSTMITTMVTEPSTTSTQKKSKATLKSTSKPTMLTETVTTEATISTTTPMTLAVTTAPTTTTTTTTTATTATTTMTTTTPMTTTMTSTSSATIPTKISTKTRTTTMKTTPLRTANPKMISTSTETYNSFSTWQDEGSESTTDTISPTLPTEDVTLLIRIIFEGSWHDVCSKLPTLRQSLAELVNNNVEKSISPRQIIFHQTQCTENLTPMALVSEIPLTSVLVYIVDENGNFDGALTKILPSLYQMTPIDFSLPIHSFQLVPEADSSNAIAVIIVSCVAFICLILLAGLLFIMRKRQGRFNYGERCRPVSLDAYSLDSVSAYNSVRRSKGALRCSKRSYGNPTFEDSSAIPTHPLNFADMETFCNDASAVDEEFASIPQVSSKIDELPPGAELKNRYANVIPLPETRVPLSRLNNDPLTEYINASYVRGPKNANKFYIACQAPTDSTVSDFWRMVWEQQCRVIIMLTDLVENGAEKCSEYIPPLEVSDCHRLYGDYQVTLKKREAKEKYAISTLHLKNLEKNTFREVWHIWYLWPANGTPADGAGLIAVLLEARALQRNATGPIVVHCSPGTGRTGTLIALDLGIRQYEITRTVDVPRVVYTIRRDRAGAVQTREQYGFIYKGLHLYASKLAGGAIEST